MKTVILASLSGMALMVSSSADAYVQHEQRNAPAQQDVREGAKRSGGAMHAGPRAPQVRHQGGSQVRGHNWGPRVQGRWHAGHRAPGGWQSYRRPFVGFQLPRYWVQPSYYIVNYANYGLQAPQPGYQWVRYYDDAVLADQRGTVAYAQPQMQWENYGDYYEEAEYGASVDAGDDYGWDDGEAVYSQGSGYGVTYDQGSYAQPAYTSQTVSNAPSYDPCDAPYAASGQVYDRSGRDECATDGKGYSKGYTKGYSKEVVVHTAAPQVSYQPAPQQVYQPTYQPAPQQVYQSAPQPAYQSAPAARPAYHQPQPMDHAVPARGPRPAPYPTAGYPAQAHGMYAVQPVPMYYV